MDLERRPAKQYVSAGLNERSRSREVVTGGPLNQFLCKAVVCAWTVRVKSYFEALFTILVENGGYK